MDAETLLPISMALSALIGIPIAVYTRKRVAPKKEVELQDHLRNIGIKTAPLENDNEQVKLGSKFSLGEKTSIILEVRDRNFDAIAIRSVSGQYGTQYYIEYILKTISGISIVDPKKTRLHRKRSSLLWGSLVDIEWKGDPYLSQRLNLDYQLKYKIMHDLSNKSMESIQIIPEPKQGYTKITTKYELPAIEVIEVIDNIAKHVKS